MREPRNILTKTKKTNIQSEKKHVVLFPQISPSVCLSVRLCSLCVSFFSVSLSPSVSLPLSVSVCLCLCLSVCLSLSLPLSLPDRHAHTHRQNAQNKDSTVGTSEQRPYQRTERPTVHAHAFLRISKQIHHASTVPLIHHHALAKMCHHTYD